MVERAFVIKCLVLAALGALGPVLVVAASAREGFGKWALYAGYAALNVGMTVATPSVLVGVAPSAPTVCVALL